MKSAKLFVIMVKCVLLIPILLFSVNCSQKENGLGEAVELASGEAGEPAPGETAELSSNKESERTRGEEGEHSSREEDEHSGGEEGEHGDSEDEESGIRYTKSETVVEVRRGIELNLKYDQSSTTFIGTIKNVSNETAKRVRVEIHLSNKKELGPTKPVDLAPGKQASVKLSAKGQSFTWWTAHAEVGSSEHKRDS